jgi:hypothetical protein
MFVCHVFQFYNGLEVRKSSFWACLYRPNKLGTNYELGPFYLIRTFRKQAHPNKWLCTHKCVKELCSQHAEQHNTQIISTYSTVNAYIMFVGSATNNRPLLDHRWSLFSKQKSWSFPNTDGCLHNKCIFDVINIFNLSDILLIYKYCVRPKLDQELKYTGWHKVTMFSK